MKKEYILLMKIWEKEFWDFIDKVNWIEDLNFVRIEKEIKNWKYWDKDFIEEIKKIFYKKHKKLWFSFKPYFWKIDFSDDTLNDFIADIIGHWKETYDMWIKNPKKILKESWSGVTESFSYIFYT